MPKTVISRECSSEWKPGDEPYYPVNNEKNGELYKKYRALAEQEEKVIFGDRLGEWINFLTIISSIMVANKSIL